MENRNATLSGPSSKRHLNGVLLACDYDRLGSVVIFRGYGPVLLRNPIFVIFQGGSGAPLPSLDPRMCGLQLRTRLVGFNHELRGRKTR